MLRPLVMSCESPSQVLASLREKGLPDHTLQAIAANLNDTASDVLAGLNPAAMTVLEASHTANWLSVNGATPIIKYAQGSIPGDPWADLFFGLIQARVMRAVRARIAEEGLQMQVEARGPYALPTGRLAQHHPVFDVSFIDDSALPVADPTPADLLHKLERVAVIVDDVLTQHALFPNYAVTKTAAVIAFHGQGSKAYRQRNQSEAAPLLPIATAQ
eukprot:1496327-Alexandrium_andersonii.AAC.1